MKYQHGEKKKDFLALFILNVEFIFIFIHPGKCYSKQFLKINLFFIPFGGLFVGGVVCFCTFINWCVTM